MKKTFALLAMLTMATASWADTVTNIKYIDANGVEQTCTSATVITASSDHVVWEAGWYVVQGTDVTLSKAVDCNGDVNLILADGAKLTINSESGQSGILVGSENTLQIYGQAKSTGQLIASGGEYCAGIGGDAKAIIINGGTITATGGYDGAGIGSAKEGTVSLITINDGIITANGGSEGAGIGSGVGNKSGSDQGVVSIIINGGKITAAGKTLSAAIGSGFTGKCGSILINGGAISATSGLSGENIRSAIGEGTGGTCESVIINKDLIVCAGNTAENYSLFSNDGTNIVSKLYHKYMAVQPEYLYFTGEADGTIKFDKRENTAGSVTATFEYCDNPFAFEPTWTEYSYGTDLTLAKDARIYFRAKGKNDKLACIDGNDYLNYIVFSSTADVTPHGSLLSLLSADCSDPLPPYAFYSLFNDCTHLTSAPELSSASLSDHCYASMFYGCTGLTSAPTLPATNLANGCYADMFAGCTNLTSTPSLPAETLADDCYFEMFLHCTGLTSVSSLPSATLKKYCYYRMFEGCTALTTAPEISASEMASNSCERMFSGCTGLATPPALPATTLAYECYKSMFENCTGLVSLPELPATTLVSSCYWLMFDGCTNLKVNTLGLGTAWTIPADATAASYWNLDMFKGTAGNYTDKPAIGTTYYVLDKPYTRTMSYAWGTVVLPFDIAYDANNTNYNLYYLSAADDKNLTFTEYASGKIAAGTPMAVKKLSGDAIEISPAGNSTFSTTIKTLDAVDGLKMNGTYENIDSKTGVYFIAQDKFWWAADAVSIAPFRAWFETSAPGAKEFTIVENDEADGIVDLNPTLSQGDGVRKYLDGGKVMIVKSGKKYSTSGSRVNSILTERNN